MPRKQLDILKDLCLAHRDRDEARYQKAARELVRYLKWKKFHLKAQEFEEVFGLREKEQEASLQVPLFNDAQFQSILESEQENPPLAPPFDRLRTPPGRGIHDPSPAEGIYGASAGIGIQEGTGEKTAWQVSQGAEVNFLKAQRVLDELFQYLDKRFTGKDFAEILGYAENKANGFARLLFYLGLLEEKNRRPTPLAELIHRYDPYFEDIGTLWFLHYWVSSQPRLLIWNRIANQLMTRAEFTREDARSVFADQEAAHTQKSFRDHLRKEFNVCTGAYLESEFKRLHLLRVETQEEDDSDRFIRTAASPVPDEILFAAIVLYHARFYPEAVALEIPSLIFPENSPGRVFYLHEAYIREALERLRLAGELTIESFADLDQIKFARTTTYPECLKIYYQEKFGR